MNIEQSKINQLRALIEWARFTLKKAANFEISFWSHLNDDQQYIEYNIWIGSGFHRSSIDLDHMVSLIPAIKELCLSNKEITS